MISARELQAVGRILMHGFLLCGYMPYFMNASVLFWLLVGCEPSSEMLLTEFLESLDEGDKHLINTSLDGNTELREEVKIRLGAFLAKYDYGVIPNKETLVETLQSLSRYTTLVKPYFYLHAIREPIKEIALKIFGQPLEDDFKDFLKSLIPTGIDVVSRS